MKWVKKLRGPIRYDDVCTSDQVTGCPRNGQIVDPTRGSAGFHDNEVRRIVFEDCGQVISVGRSVDKLMFASFCIKVAAHGIEFAEIKSENIVWFSLGLGLEFCDALCFSTEQDHRLESPDFIRMAPTPNPGLTWILSSARSGLCYLIRAVSTSIHAAFCV